MTILDITGRAQPIGSTPWLRYAIDLSVRDVLVAPDQQHVAFLKFVGRMPPNPGIGPPYNSALNSSSY